MTVARWPSLALTAKDFEGNCLHQFDTRLECDGWEHYYPCIMEGCRERQYFCKHTRPDRFCPSAGENHGS